MAKSNPLFVDSTILHGDRIGTHIELSKVLAYDDEMVIVLITNQIGETQRVVMKINDKFRYHARVWLGHQKSITYRFIIEKDGREFLQTATRQARAQYAIVDDWVPVLPEGNLRFQGEKSTTEVPQTSGPMFGEYVSGVASLIDKWGL
jgi:hypothetical protein